MPCAIRSDELALFQCLLIGTWENDPKLTEKKRPLAYNVMPLPQNEAQPHRPAGTPLPKYGGFILKNFTFTETIRFNGTAKKKDSPLHQDPGAVAVVAGAPNRGGTYTQFAHAVFYEQQVRFAEGPQGPRKGHPHGDIVHLENGAWLHLGSRHQDRGPYGPETVKGQVLDQPPYITIAKQIAVPHGNSVLALGSVDLFDKDHYKGSASGIQANTIIPGAPIIPDAPVPYPIDSDIATKPYYDPYAKKLSAANDYENPSVEWTLNPNYPLQRALEIIKPKFHIHFRVTTNPLFGGDGVVTNIPFENRKSKVTEYWADYWLLSTDPKAPRSMKFDYLMYNQTILMEMKISHDKGKTEKTYTFPHVTCNTVKKVPGTPTEARKATPTALE